MPFPAIEEAGGFGSQEVGILSCLGSTDLHMLCKHDSIPPAETYTLIIPPSCFPN